jgi:hypothetical protein
MDTAVLPSTFVLTLLLAVGLFFFIKASVKDRIEQVKLASESAQESLLTDLQQYFADRAYRVAAVDAPNYKVTFEGFVRPSWFLAIFLTLLSAGGTLCLGLVLGMLVPQQGQIFLALGYFIGKKLDALSKSPSNSNQLLSREAKPRALLLSELTAMN